MREEEVWEIVSFSFGPAPAGPSFWLFHLPKKFQVSFEIVPRFFGVQSGRTPAPARSGVVVPRRDEKDDNLIHKEHPFVNEANVILSFSRDKRLVTAFDEAYDHQMLSRPLAVGLNSEVHEH